MSASCGESYVPEQETEPQAYVSSSEIFIEKKATKIVRTEAGATIEIPKFITEDVEITEIIDFDVPTPTETVPQQAPTISSPSDEEPVVEKCKSMSSDPTR